MKKNETNGEPTAAVYADKRQAALAINTETRKLWVLNNEPHECYFIFANTARQAKDAAIECLWGEPIKPLTRDERQQFVNDVMHEMAEELAGKETV